MTRTTAVLATLAAILAAILAAPAVAEPTHKGFWLSYDLTAGYDVENETRPYAWADVSANYTLASGMTLFVEPHIVLSKRAAITGSGAASGCTCKGATIYSFDDTNRLRIGATVPLGANATFRGYLDVAPNGGNTQAVVEINVYGTWK